MELNRFSKANRNELENMNDSEISVLSLIERIERALIVNGYTDHEICRKIEMVDVKATGADSVSFTIISTRKRCRKPSLYHDFVLDEIHGTMTVTGFGNL